MSIVNATPPPLLIFAAIATPQPSLIFRCYSHTTAVIASEAKQSIF